METKKEPYVDYVSLEPSVDHLSFSHCWRGFAREKENSHLWAKLPVIKVQRKPTVFSAKKNYLRQKKAVSEERTAPTRENFKIIGLETCSP